LCYSIQELFHYLTLKVLVHNILYNLGDVPCEELLVIVIDTLDECGGLRHDSFAKDDYKNLLHILKC